MLLPLKVGLSTLYSGPGYAWVAVSHHQSSFKILDQTGAEILLEHSRNVQQIFSPLTVHMTQLSENLLSAEHMLAAWFEAGRLILFLLNVQRKIFSAQ